MEFEVKRIGEICKKVYSGGTPTSSNASYYDGGIPWLNTNEVNFCNIYSTNKTISEEGLNHSAAKYIPVNSVIVAMYGVTAGRSAVAKIPLTTNQACCNLIIDEEKAYYQYVYHFLRLQSDNLNKLANGGAQQNLNSLIIKKFKVSLPSLDAQHRIASILSAYDNLIENNNKRIRLLEQMAENLYKEWFVRFRFPGHEKAEFENGLPMGWKVMKLDKILTVRYGKDHSKIEDGDIPILGSGGIMRFGNKELYASESVLIPRKGSLNNIMYIDEPFWTVDTMFFTEMKYKNIAKYVYYVLSGIDMESFNSGAALPSMTTNILNHFKVILPSEDVLALFDEKVELLFLQKKKLIQQNTLLSRQRDLLLPRLMSGKLEVNV